MIFVREKEVAAATEAELILTNTRLCSAPIENRKQERDSSLVVAEELIRRGGRESKFGGGY